MSNCNNVEITLDCFRYPVTSISCDFYIFILYFAIDISLLNVLRFDIVLWNLMPSRWVLGAGLYWPEAEFRPVAVCWSWGLAPGTLSACGRYRCGWDGWCRRSAQAQAARRGSPSRGCPPRHVARSSCVSENVTRCWVFTVHTWFIYNAVRVRPVWEISFSGMCLSNACSVIYTMIYDIFVKYIWSVCAVRTPERRQAFTKGLNFVYFSDILL